MGDPLFWLGLSLLLVAVSLTAVLLVAIPTLRELSRAARSAEKLFDTLGRELPPTLEAIRLTGLEITDLTDDVSDGIQHAGRVVQQVDESLGSARRQAKSLQTGTRSFWAGARAAWKAWAQETKPAARKRPKSLSHRPTSPRLTRPQRSPDASSSVSQADQNRPSPRLPSAPHSAQESLRYPRQPHVAPPEAAAHNRADPAHQHQNMDNLQVPDPWAEPDRHPRRPPQNDVERRSASALSEATTTEPDSANPPDD